MALCLDYPVFLLGADELVAFPTWTRPDRVLELARSGADVKAVVSNHGILKTANPAEPDAVRAHVAVYTGACDPFVPRNDVEAFRAEMIAAQARWQITEFGGAFHAFTDPDADRQDISGLAYDRIADRISWAGTEALLAELLGSSQD